MLARQTLFVFGALSLSLSSAPAFAAQVVNFDTIATFSTVDDYYAGGTDSAGETGPNYGISFLAGDWITTTSFGETSPPNLAYSDSGAGSVDFINGITTGLNFSYGAFSDTSFMIYSGRGGSGTLLAAYLLPTNNPLRFDFEALPFNGVAHSIVIAGGAGQFGWDDITFGGLTPVPEPATWAMMLLSFSAVGVVFRQQRNMTFRYA